MSAPFNTAFEAFAAAARAYPGNDFLHIPRQATAGYADDALTVSYGEAAEGIETLRQRYLAAGYDGGCRVALALDNRIEFFLHMLALNALGASVLPLNMGLSDSELQHLVRHADAALVMSLPDYAARLAGLVQVPVGDTAAAVIPPHRQVAGAELAPGEAAIVYTSGTTGQPKGCMLSNDYFNALGTWYRELGGHCVLRPGEERLITPLPLSHMNALVASTMGMIHAAGCIIQLDRFHASTWWETVRESRATCLHYLGVMPAILLNMPASAGDDPGGRIRFGFGAGVDPRHQAAFEQRFGLPLIEGWSMTEVGGAAAISASEEPRYVGERCFGRPVSGMEYRLVGEDGGDVPVGMPGELLVRRAGEDPRRLFFSGYYKDDEATAAAWEGGWFHTGDIVRRNDDEVFFFVDRKKNIVRRSGENIAAVEVEAVLQQHPAVEACVVAPVPDEIRGEEVAAIVIAATGAAADAATVEDILAFCAGELAYFKVPGYLMFADALPVTASQKIRRGEAKQEARARVEQGDAFDMRDRKRQRAR